MSLFNALPVTTEGIGNYRVNRFRLYFRVPDAHREKYFKGQSNSQIAGYLGKEILPSFAKIFNPNIATVTHRSKKYKNKETLQFIIKVPYLLPDIHDDWVGVEHDHSRGFTVQTLYRKFWIGCDTKLVAATTGGGAVGLTGMKKVGGWAATKMFAKKANPVGWAIAAWGAGAGLFAGAGATDLNAAHFLAGRRSWVVGTKQDFGRDNVEGFDKIPDDAFAIETAAVERLSGKVVELASEVGWPINMDDAVHDVWVIFLNNYIKFKAFEEIQTTGWSKSDRGVGYVATEFKTLAAAKGSALYTNIDKTHMKLLP